MSNFQDIAQASTKLCDLLNSKIFGQKEIVEQIVLTILCNGHALLTGAPGVAKTTLVRNLAKALGSGYKRIQFTPDLTPFDILGGYTIQFDEKDPNLKKIGFSPGPIFAPFILADEINRASPRTQSALLEAMQERQVSIEGVSRPLPKPFFVFATQNPIENEGTFPLPEAQLDRFLLNLEIPYPDLEAEVKIATLSQMESDLEPIPFAAILLEARRVIESVPIKEDLLQGIVRIVRNTRPHESKLSVARDYLEFGASPRATQALLIASKALAVIRGQSEVQFDNVNEIAPAVLRHRCIVNFRSLAEKRSVSNIVNQIVQETVL
ncbi:AAA family ATPase [Fluviispira vulneris]|uniref:AAA family ATPase n=1 Tax=Fluviispira vulneris TaxID=2763012 RepID=UPI001648E850|nr:MoxR family ATPase [Fluviispira vulneris]